MLPYAKPSVFTVSQLVLLTGLFAIAACAQGQPPSPPASLSRVVEIKARAGRELNAETISSDDAEILRRFLSECIEITPGSGRYPSECQIGQTEPRQHELAKRLEQVRTPFRICRYEVTQELFEVVMGFNPSRWQGPHNSVERMSFQEAILFCQRLTELLQQREMIATDQVVRLPTYVEWEYCCRAGSVTRYEFGAEAGTSGQTELLDQYAWHTGNAAGNDPEVGVLKPNAWGLYDCHGYLWEFVDGSIPTDISVTKTECVIRGGAWTDPYPLLSSAAYLTVSKSVGGDNIGFRCVVAREQPAKKTSNR